jgi:methanogenic corrinoid protein MtbC1
MYSDADIRRFRLLRSAVEGGRMIGHVAGLSDAELEELNRQAEPLREPAGTVRPRDAGSSVLTPLLESVAACDYAAVDAELGRLALLLGPAQLVHEVVLPLMRLAGEYWESGKFHIAHEHLVSACVRNLVGGLVRRPGPANGGPRLLLTTPLGELHEFGILAAAMLAVTHEIQAGYLGPNLPAAEILFAARRHPPDAVVLGIMKVNATAGVCAEVRRLASELPAATELWIGGSGAAAVAGGVSPGRAIILENLSELDRHLMRLKESAR